MIQLADRWQYHLPERMSFYPLTRFAMYQTGSTAQKVESYRFEGRIDGVYREINLTEEFRAIGLPAINSKFRMISKKLRSQHATDVRWAESQLAHYCQSVVRLGKARGESLPDEIRFIVLQYEVDFLYQTPVGRAVCVYKFSSGDAT